MLYYYHPQIWFPGSKPIPTVNITASKLETYAGTYFNAGYGSGNLTLCTRSTDSEQCKQVMDDFSSFREKDASHTIYASLPTLWSSHVRMRFVGNDTFKIQITYLFPEGYGKDKTPFEYGEEGENGGTIRFAVNRDEDSMGIMVEEILGFGLFDTVGAVTDREKKGGSVEETAEVWFEKLQ